MIQVYHEKRTAIRTKLPVLCNKTGRHAATQLPADSSDKLHRCVGGIFCTRIILDIVSLTNQTFTNFVSGQLTEAVIIGVLCFFGMLILEMPYAGAISAFVAVPALVPIFGAWIGGEAFGILGILFSVPVCAVLYSLYLEFMKKAGTLYTACASSGTAFSTSRRIFQMYTKGTSATSAPTADSTHEA